MNKLSPTVKKIASITGILLGAFALSVAAADIVPVGWSPAPCTPDNCNTAPPINTGLSKQSKIGPMAIGKSEDPTNMFDVSGDAVVTGVLGAAQVMTNGLRVTSEGHKNNGYVLTTDGSGNAEWKPVPVPQTQAVSCTDVGNTSYLSLNGNNSGNNQRLIVKIATLTSGTYTFSGSGNTYNVGGGGVAGIMIVDSPNYTDEQLLATGLVGESYGTGSSYKWYYNGDNSSVIAVLKRSGLSDGPFTVPPVTITVSGTKYVYVVLAQASITGSLTVSSSKSICGGSGNQYSILTGTLVLSSDVQVLSTGTHATPYTVTVTGAVVGDLANVALPSNYNYASKSEVCGPTTAAVSAGDTVKVHFWNSYGAATCTIPAGTYKVYVTKLGS